MAERCATCDKKPWACLCRLKEEYIGWWIDRDGQGYKLYRLQSMRIILKPADPAQLRLSRVPSTAALV